MKRFRWLGLPAVAALAVLLFALTAGIGSARTAVAPNNTSPPTISGKAQVGELLKADPGTWTGTPPTLTYQGRICDNNGGACHDITGATGNEYTLKSADQGNTVRVQVTGKNTDGTDTATSVPSALIAAGTATTPTATTPTPGPSGTGCPKLAAGATSVAATDVSPPARLQVTQMQANPGVITLGTKTFSVKFRVSDTCGSPVKGAQVYATTVPFNQFSIPSQSQTDDSGSVTMQFNMLRGFPAATQQRLLVMFVRASKPGDPILAGISTRRLISFRVNLHG
jgi:hypothetical protein